MRVMLASLVCEKGDIDGNLAGHVEVLRQARHERCHLAVFPEFSLTGSVDPRHHRERAVTVDHPAVRRLVAATAGTAVGALFGIAERDGGELFITQVYAWGGRVLGVQRKRHLGDGEEGFGLGQTSALFELGAARFGAVICAEAGIDLPWDAAAGAGARAVFLCSAPGLHGRRTTPAAWRAGLEWWEGCGLADARAQAKRLGLWVGMATQAGATRDEDFPGISALVSPDGEVVDRLPDWEPGVLAADVPVAVEVEPVRWSVRVLVVDDGGRTLLVQFGDSTGARWWVPPGGGIEAGEDDHAAARRELFEELGRDDLAVGPPIGGRGGTVLIEGRWLTQNEHWYLCRCRHFEVAPEVVAAGRAEGIRDMRWWSSDEMRAAGITTGPRDLADLLDAVVAGRLPSPDADLGL